MLPGSIRDRVKSSNVLADLLSGRDNPSLQPVTVLFFLGLALLETAAMGHWYGVGEKCSFTSSVGKIVSFIPAKCSSVLLSRV